MQATPKSPVENGTVVPVRDPPEGGPKVQRAMRVHGRNTAYVFNVKCRTVRVCI